MKTLIAAVLALAIFTPLPAWAQHEGRGVCISIADAVEQEAKVVAAEHAKMLQLSGPEIASFNAFLGSVFNEEADIVTLFVFPDLHGEFTVGSKEQDIKCSMPDFTLSPAQVLSLLRVVRGIGA